MIKHLKPKTEEEMNLFFQQLSPNEKLLEGCKQGFVNLVKDALKEGANEHKKTNDPVFSGGLSWAIIYNHAEIVKLLIDDGANLTWYSAYGKKEIKRLLKTLDDKASDAKN